MSATRTVSRRLLCFAGKCDSSFTPFKDAWPRSSDDHDQSEKHKVSRVREERLAIAAARATGSACFLMATPIGCVCKQRNICRGLVSFPFANIYMHMFSSPSPLRPPARSSAKGQYNFYRVEKRKKKRKKKKLKKVRRKKISNKKIQYPGERSSGKTTKPWANEKSRPGRRRLMKRLDPHGRVRLTDTAACIVITTPEENWNYHTLTERLRG